jgi:carboxyl-terminal processing protease
MKENMNDYRKSRRVSLKSVIAIVLITNLITGALLIFAPIPFIGGKRLVSSEEYNFVKQFGRIVSVKNVIEDNYVDKITEAQEQKMVEGAIKGMADSLGDPYTVYMNNKEFQDFMTQTEGSYAGLGIYVGDKDGRIVVIAPIEDTPAERAGIKSGDFILKVDGKEVTAKEMDQAVSMMKGKEGTKVKITIQRNNQTVDYTLTRAKIVLKTVKGEMLKNKIGYIRITMFDENTAEAFSNALSNLKDQGMRGLVIDLRDNPGGLLDECTKIADQILGQGTMVYTINNNEDKEEWKSDADKLDVPLALLVNGGSASASEIVSGAVRDFEAGTLIGTKTFGKGLVQSIIPMSDGTGVKVTIARYYTPSGESIQGKGITPDIVIDLPEKLKNKEVKHEEDVQLQKAIEVINSKM